MSNLKVRPSDDDRNQTQSRRELRALSLRESETEINPRHHQLMSQCKQRTLIRWIQAQTWQAQRVALRPTNLIRYNESLRHQSVMH